MTKTKFTLSVLATFLFIVTCATAGQAAPRTFVAGSGSDANAPGCTFTLPCRFLSTAYANTDVGGEIIALTPAGYGGLAITHAVTVQAIPGQWGFISVVASSSGISVAAGAAENVVIRNFQFSGTPAVAANSIGITHTSGRLIIENCTFSQLATGFRATGGTIVALNSSFLSNSTRGVHLSGTAKMDLQDCNISFNGKGVTVDGAGGCPNPGNPTVAPTTAARLDGGIVANNTTFAFEMLNPGPTPCSPTGHGQNIFLRINANGTDFSTSVPGYANTATNFLFVTGVEPTNQVLIGVYNNNNQGRQP